MNAPKPTPSRHYCIRSKDGRTILAMIRAVNMAQAREFYMDATITIANASQDAMYEAAVAGVPLQDANGFRSTEAGEASVRG